MGYFIYNGTSSQRFGILEHNPIPPKSEENYDDIVIPGRREAISRTLPLRSDIVLPQTLGLTSQAELRAVYRWLRPPGTLIMSSRPSERYDVKRIRITPENAGKRFARLRIDFTCSPYAKRVGEKDIVITEFSDTTLITNTGTAPALPVFTIMLEEQVSDILLGDVNEDGVINASDAALVLIAAAAIGAGEDPGLTERQLIEADINKDGVINATDAAIILQIAAANGAGEYPDSVYDVYLMIGDTTMRIMAPQICSTQQYPITVDSERQIVYYTDESGTHINILQNTFGDFPEFPVGESEFRCTGPVTEVRLRMNEVVV
ncbi:MAG: phage tail family protein [Oscillospiraceae bacterium]|nr:phage tail family protein [Oscillospiraceae bacterium]